MSKVPESEPHTVIGIMQAGGTFSVALHGPRADAAYEALKAQGFEWPLHATWKTRAQAQKALEAVQSRLGGLQPPDPRVEALRALVPYALGHHAGVFCCRVCLGKSTTTYSKDIVHTSECPLRIAF